MKHDLHDSKHWLLKCIRKTFIFSDIGSGEFTQVVHIDVGELCACAVPSPIEKPKAWFVWLVLALNHHCSTSSLF